MLIRLYQFIMQLYLCLKYDIFSKQLEHFRDEVEGKIMKVLLSTNSEEDKLDRKFVFTDMVGPFHQGKRSLFLRCK